MSNTNKSADKFYNFGNDFYEFGEFQQAIFYYDEAIKLDPSWYKPYYNKSLSYACLENYSANEYKI